MFPKSTVTKGQQIGVSGNTGGVGYHCILKSEWEAIVGMPKKSEGLLARSASDGYGGVYGRVKTSSDAWVRRCRISGASKPTDYNYGATYTYALMANGNPFPDESAYGINYYIGRASTGRVTLSYNNGAKTQVVTIRPNTDFLVSTVYLP